MRIAVLLPCFNEEITIAEVVAGFTRALPGAPIYVYDNNSTDATAARAAAAGAIVRREPLQGKGNVVRRMFADIEADVYIMADGDGTYDPGSAPEMVRMVAEDGIDMVVGARKESGEAAAWNQRRRLGNRLLTGFVARLFGKRFTDILSGYRAFSRRFVKSFPALAPGFEIETELTVHALELRVPVAEIDTPYIARPEGSQSKLRTSRDGARILRTIFLLLKEERPFRFFGAISLALAVVSVALAYPLLIEFLETGLVPRIPTAVLCTGLMLLAFLSLTCGLILDSVSRGRREIKRIAHLAVPRTGAGGGDMIGMPAKSPAVKPLGMVDPARSASDAPGASATVPPRWLGRLTVWHAVALGLVVRLLVLALFPDQGFPDAKAYVAAGQNLFARGDTGDPTYMPLYPIWTYFTGGGVTLKLADIVLSLATIWVIFELSLAILTDRAAALMAAFAAAVWPHFAFYAVSGLTETAYAFVVTLGFLMLYRKRWWWGIVLLALSMLIRPTLEPLIPILLIVFAVIVHRESWRRAALLVVQFAVVYVVVMSPWWVHQYARYGQFVRLNLGLGIVLYSGNNPTNRSGGGVGYKSNDGRVSDHDPSHPAWGIKDPVARDRALTQAAITFVRANPGRFATLAAIKFKRFWRLWPHAAEYQSAAIIAVSLLSYGVILLATLAFLLVHARSRWRVLAPVLVYSAFLTAVHMVTIGSIRYRFPLEPFLIVLGSYSVARLLVRGYRRLDFERH